MSDWLVSGETTKNKKKRKLCFIFCFVCSITSCLSLVGGLSWLVRLRTQLETQMVAVERVLEYTSSVEPEEINSNVVSHDKVDRLDHYFQNNNNNNNNINNNNKDVRLQGKLEFEQFSMRYRPGLPVCLNNVSFVVEVCFCALFVCFVVL
jgi:ABC-type multidrug transport system fused ATPase/permease subunit